MKPARRPVIKLQAYLLDADRARLAKAAGCKPVYLTHLAHGHSRASVKLALAFEKATDGRVTRHDLRPDLFGKSA